MIREITENEKEIFNKVAVHPLQSWEWGAFREKHGNSVKRYGVFEGNKLISSFQIIFSHIPKTPFTIGTVIRGPKPTREMLQWIKAEGKKHRSIFIKLEPFIATKIQNPKDKIQKLEENQKIVNVLRNAGAIKGKTFFTPTSFWIDLTKSEEELLSGFHSKTRYNIRLAQKKGVVVSEDNSDRAFEQYIKLFFETTKRQGYYMHTEKYHRLMWDTLHRSLITDHRLPIARLLTAKYKGEVLTTWVVFVFHDFLYYPYGGSSDKYKEVMSNNAMMWEAIRYGKSVGLKTFDLWGREDGKGFTKFKEGYNPKVVEFVGTWDLPTSPLYKAYTIAEKVRWKLLRLRATMLSK